MTLKETLAELEAMGNEKVRAQNKKKGAGDNQYGVRMGDIRKLAKKIKKGKKFDLHKMGIVSKDCCDLPK